MVDWFFSSVLCCNNHKSIGLNGEKLKYYRLPRENSEIQSQYKVIFRIDRFNWNDGHICVAHWSIGGEKTYMICQVFLLLMIILKKVKQKCITAKNVKNKWKNST